MLPVDSTVPIILTLSRFLENFPDIGWYPNWYLGNPYNYLIGPVIPTLLGISNLAYRQTGFQLLLSNLMTWEYFGLILFSWLLGGVGMYKLVDELGSEKKQSIISALLFLSLPLAFLFFTASDGLYHFAWGFLLWTFVIFLKFLNEKESKFVLLLSFLIAFLLLIDVSIFLPFLIGIICLSVVRKISEYHLLQTVFAVLLGVSIATVWYTPMFWWTLLQNPSFGGFPLINLSKLIFQFLLNLLPIMTAIWVVKLQKRKPNPALFFGLLFTFSFLLLTLIRFLADPDFMRDWIGFFIEIQFGGAVLVGGFLNKLKFKHLKYIAILITLFLSVISSFWIVKNWIGNTKSDYQTRVLQILKTVPVGERIFLSGTPVFWVNEFLNLQQVRGGVDQASIHPFWAHAAYQIREGGSEELTLDWFKALGVNWVLVHGEGSEEPFHDFKHTEKFRCKVSENLLPDRQIGCQISENNAQKSDILYEVEGVSIGRIADKSILNTRKPKNGADVESLNKYLTTFKRPIGIKFREPGGIILDTELDENEVVSLAISFHPDWKLSGEGKVLKDSLGNMVIVPKNGGRQQFRLKFKEQLWEWMMPAFISLVLIFMIVKYDKLYPGLSRALGKLGHGLEEE